MLKSEPQTPMPLPKFWLNVALGSLALIILILLFTLNRLNQDRLTGMIVSIMVSFFIISLTELVPEFYRRWETQSENGKFRVFFGEAAVRFNVRLVFAHRRLNPELAGSAWLMHKPPPLVQGTSPVPEGVGDWLAVQDVRAAVYLANTIYTHTGHQVAFIHDKEIDGEDFDYCAISIGLGFNSFTRHLAKLCDPKIFEIRWEQSMKQSFGPPTDGFALGNLELPQPPEGKDYSLIARIVIETPPSKPQRVVFVCAGRTASGTAVAGYYLSQHWDVLHRLYSEYGKDLNRDSMALVIRHTADETGDQEFIIGGKILADDQSKKFVAWGRAADTE